MNKNFFSVRFGLVGLLFIVGLFFISQAIFNRAPAAVTDLLSPKGGGLEAQPVDTGQVGTWTSAGIFPTPRERYSMVYANGYAYVLGGTVGWGFDGDITSTVLYAPVSTDGNFGEWKYTKNLPVEANFDAAAFTANGFVYVVGGHYSKENFRLNPTASVWYSKIQPDRSLGEWVNASPLPFPTADHDLVYRNGYVYVVGGYTRDSSRFQLDKVFYAKVNSDGTLGDWRETYSLPVPLSRHQVVVIGNHIYALGGEDAAGFSVRTVYYTGFNPDGSLNHWIEATPLPNKLEGFYADTLGGYVYVVGGSGFGVRGYKDVWFSKKISNDGTLANWKATASLPLEISNIGGFMANKKIHIIGGQLDFNGPGNVTDKIWRAGVDVAEVQQATVGSNSGLSPLPE